MAYLFINYTGSIGQIISQGTTDITGTLVATILVIIVVLFSIGLLFSIPLEFIFLLLLPILIVSATYNSTVFMVCLILIILFFGMIITKNFLFR